MGKTIIVADDYLQCLCALTMALKLDFPDVQVDHALTGRVLTQKVLQGNYAVVITDNNMEGTDDGLKAVKQIRSVGNAVPIYMITAGSSETTQEALRYGVEKVYEKRKFDSEVLVRDIAKHLQ